MQRFFIAAALAVLAAPVLATPVDFQTFKIRNNDGSIVAPYDADMTIVENAAGNGFSAETPRSGQKVGYGTSAFDGLSLNDFQSVNWDKVSGKVGVVAYLNFWVTDGTNHAVIASENDYRGTDFQTRTEWKVFEYSPGSLDWLLDAGTAGIASQYLQKNGSNVTLADFADNVVLYGGPGVGAAGVGTGAPQGGYGFNLIFGDTQSNFVGSYELENVTVTVDGQTFTAANAVPAPASLALLGAGLLGFAARRRRVH